VVHSLKRRLDLREAGDSIQRLGVRRDRSLPVHCRPGSRHRGGLSALAELKEQGPLRHIASPTSTSSNCGRSSKIAPVETLQPPYSLIDREGERRSCLPEREASA